MRDTNGSPYLLPAEGLQAIQTVLHSLSNRVALLRLDGRLTSATLKDYYGEKRFEQIAESNALEGSTLSVGETELAVLRGITISGHDPGFSRDAQNLAIALDQLAEMARMSAPTDIEQLQRLHELILGGRNTAGVFRRDEVRIRGSAHVPPRTWREVMDQMEHWEDWSRNNTATPTTLRASVLHAWLEHIHPFTDGNGRTGRAITNLELIRAGYPPIIIRRKDRDQYLEALRNADNGDLGAFVEIVAGRLEDSLRDLERAATRKQGYDVIRQRIHHVQSNRLSVWNAGVHLLFASLRSQLFELFDGSPTAVEPREFDPLNVDDFIELCEAKPVRLSWAFSIRLRSPGMPVVERLAWASFPGSLLTDRLARDSGRPVIKWSVPNPAGYPPWMMAGSSSPGGEEMTILNDRWLVVRGGTIREQSPSELAQLIVKDLASAVIPDQSL